MVFTQMTKTDVLTAATGGDHVPDLHLVAGDDDAIDEKLHQLPFLRKVGVPQSVLDAPAEVFN